MAASEVIGTNCDPYSVLWGKSNAGGTPTAPRMHLLLAHLLDTAAVAEVMWDEYLAPRLRSAIDACAAGEGRRFFALLCAWHDIGKATPAFQGKDETLAERVRHLGLTWGTLTAPDARRWHHTKAGAHTLRAVLPEAGWTRSQVAWVWPLIAGHHGVVPDRAAVSNPPTNAQGGGAWHTVQHQLVHRVAAELGLSVADAAPEGRPRRSVQLALSGLIIMADWIASNDREFEGVADLGQVNLANSRGRARAAWDRLGLRGGWDLESLQVAGDRVRERFGVPARAAQQDVIALVERMQSPGLIIVEAPMGEGKTEAALAAAEVLAQRFGADGVFVGMPTQATSDPMFSRVRAWRDGAAPGVPVALLHGKRRFNREWHDLQQQASFSGVDDWGLPDAYGVDATTENREGDIPAEWFLGRKRGLLTPIAVGTIDQLLHAATRTKHVMLRHAGLAARIVILDEVHAYDVYMSQFLREGLRWLADAGVPVILLSATLPPQQRRELVEAYLQGALQMRDLDLSGLPEPVGYPGAIAASVVNGEPHYEAVGGEPWRPPAAVRINVVDEMPDDAAASITGLLAERLAEGGCALVVRNTVRRAQETYTALRERFGSDVLLLHARLTAGERAERTERVLRLLGPSGDRPLRLIVVATQLAEQSFDVDADLLITDLAPIDLLLQRIGRLHRHDRPSRPTRVDAPSAVVVGLERRPGRAPAFPQGSRYVYGDHLLLRSAALVLEADGATWEVPTAVPALVARAYSGEDLVPFDWAEAAANARSEHAVNERTRAENARKFLLSSPDQLGLPDLAGLHRLNIGDLEGDEDKVAAVVRDGEPSIEAVLVRRDEAGYRTLDGRPLGPNGEAVSDPDIAERVMAASIRLPPAAEVTRAALEELRPLAGWGADPWLRRSRALILDEAGEALLGKHRFRYDDELGLLDVREGAR